jgi:tellurite resistance protein TehA-like permease
MRTCLGSWHGDIRLGIVVDEYSACCCCVLPFDYDSVSTPDQVLGNVVTNCKSINIEKTDLSSMTAAWLLSIVPAVIASATGGIVAEVLENPQHQLWTLIISYVLWGTSIPLAFVIIVLYFHRLTVHKMLSKEAVVTVFLPIAPLGFGGYA